MHRRFRYITLSYVGTAACVRHRWPADQRSFSVSEGLRYTREKLDDKKSSKIGVRGAREMLSGLHRVGDIHGNAVYTVTNGIVAV